MKNYKSKLRQTPKRSSLMNSAIWIAVWSILLSGVVASINIKFDPVQENEVVAIQTPTPKPEQTPDEQTPENAPESRYFWEMAKFALVNHACKNFDTYQIYMDKIEKVISESDEERKGFLKHLWLSALEASSILYINDLREIRYGIETGDQQMILFCNNQKLQDI